MDVHAPKYAANAIGFVFAAVGFGLSIIALVVSSVVPSYQFAPEDFVYQAETKIPGQSHKPPSAPVIRRPKLSLKRNSQSSVSSSEGPPTPKDIQTISPRICRSPSSASSSSETEADAKDQRPYVLRKPTSLTFSQPSASQATSVRGSPPNGSKTIWVSSDVTPRKASKLAGLTSPWKEHEPKIPRQMSSPHLTRATPSFLTTTGTAQQVQLASSKVMPCKRLEKILMLRRCKSLPSSPRSKSAPSTKKRQQLPRTQPYEAPYFAPLPQPVFIEKQEATRRKRPHRSRTLDSMTHRSTSTFHTAHSDVPPVPPLPPSFTRQST